MSSFDCVECPFDALLQVDLEGFTLMYLRRNQKQIFIITSFFPFFLNEKCMEFLEHGCSWIFCGKSRTYLYFHALRKDDRSQVVWKTE
jgi:hypothetical protein